MWESTRRFRFPIAVFPATNFPRIIIGVDNGVMPIDQMEVTITRPIEEAVNSVPGLEDVRSTTSRGSAEMDLSFNWNVDMVQTLQQVNSALARIQSTLPSTAQIETHRLDFASFPILGYSLTSDKVPQTQLWELATYDLKPRLNRLNGVRQCLVQGGQEPEFQVTPDPARMLRAQRDAAGHSGRRQSHELDRFAGPAQPQSPAFLGLITAQVQTPEEIGDIVIKNVNDVPVRIRDIGTVAPSTAPDLYGGHRERKARGAAQHQPPARQQHGGGRGRSPSGDRRPSLDSSRRRRAERFLRPVQHREGIDRQRARRDHHRTFPYRASSSGCFCATWARR